ncbi:MAG: AgmX/PglI C-terminal domain-containing protein [Deltaproteobacteria bacterium]|nr:AgmX/PglI C-terminal domain-containing protein [Deltaproteobacteria bacterium]
MRHSTKEKVLRVGVIFGGRVIEERLFKKAENVSVGTAKSAVFAVPGAALPEKREVIVVKRGRYHLACGDDLSYRVTSAGSTSEHRASDQTSRLPPRLSVAALAKADASRPLLPLSDDAQGRVQIGEVTVLFQFVTPPPEPPTLQLPEMTMVRWSSRVDRPFLAVFLWTVLLHVGVVMAVQSAPLPKEPTGILDDRGRIIDVSTVIPPKPPVDEPKAGDGKGTKTPEKPKTPKSPTRLAGDGGGPQDIGAIRDKVRSAGVIGILYAKAPLDSALSKVIGGGNTVDAAAVLKDVSSGQLASLDERLARGPIQIGHGEGGPVGIEPLETGSRSNPGGMPGPGTGGTKTEIDIAKAGPQWRFEDEPPQVDGCLDPTVISKTVKSRLRSIQSCYERELKKNPALAGKITIAFTISSEGAVVETRVEHDTMNNTAVADCIMGAIRRLKFATSECGNVPVSYPFVFVKTQ